MERMKAFAVENTTSTAWVKNALIHASAAIPHASEYRRFLELTSRQYWQLTRDCWEDPYLTEGSMRDRARVETRERVARAPSWVKKVN